MSTAWAYITGDRVPRNLEWGTLMQIVPTFCHVSKFQAADCLHYNAAKWWVLPAVMAISRISIKTPQYITYCTSFKSNSPLQVENQHFYGDGRVKTIAENSPKHVISGKKNHSFRDLFLRWIWVPLPYPYPQLSLLDPPSVPNELQPDLRREAEPFRHLRNTIFPIICSFMFWGFLTDFAWS